MLDNFISYQRSKAKNKAKFFAAAQDIVRAIWLHLKSDSPFPVNSILTKKVRNHSNNLPCRFLPNIVICIKYM